MSRSLPIRLTVAALLLVAIGLICLRMTQHPNGEAGSTDSAHVHVRPGLMNPVKATDLAGVENAYQLAPNLWIGSQPEGTAGVETMHRLGIQTIVSVDGASPDLKTFHDVRYIHIPVGYDGITREKQLAIAAIIANPEQYGNVYLHCHYGKHRGPAAAAAALRCVDPQFSAEQANAFLKQVGTDPRYAGLYRDVHDALPATDAERLQTFQYTNRMPVGGLVERMVAIDETWDRIKACEKAGWATPPGHPDVSPAHEALQLVEHYRELGRLPSLPGGEFAKFLKDAEAAAVGLERNLQINANSSAIQAAFKRNAKLCAECHAATRDRKAK